MATNSYPGPETIHRFSLDNGLTVILYQNPTSQTVAINGIIRAGSLAESVEKAGLADFTADLLMRGTENRTFDEIFETLETVGAGLSFGSARHTTGFSGYCLAEDLVLIMDMLAESLCRPTFPSEHIEKLRGQIITGLEMRANDTRRMARLAFQELAYPHHPYRLSVSGYPETIATITREELADFHTRHFGPHGMILTIVGAIQIDETLHMVERTLGRWQNDQQVPIGPVPEAVWPTGLIRRHVAMPDKRQADIIMGLPGPNRAAHDYLDASLMNTILGVFGMMGRIGQNVREEQGLAYYAGSRLEGGLGPGPWVASAGVAPENVDQAIESIRYEIKRIQDEPIAADELADSQAYRTGSLPMSLETNGGIADTITNMELYHLGLDYLHEYPRLINEITVERVQAAARKYLSADNLAVAVSGPIEAL
jgi:zinc protease